MSQKIQVRRGPEASLPTLDIAEIGFTTDTGKYFVGSATGNIELAKKDNTGKIIGSITGDATTVGGGYKIQSGLTGVIDATTRKTITYPTAFSSGTPIVTIIAISSSAGITCSIVSSSIQSFDFISNGSSQYMWITVGT